MITERTLRQWRRFSLDAKGMLKRDRTADIRSINVDTLLLEELHDRILRMTQDLLDQHLTKGK